MSGLSYEAALKHKYKLEDDSSMGFWKERGYDEESELDLSDPLSELTGECEDFNEVYKVFIDEYVRRKTGGCG